MSAAKIPSIRAQMRQQEILTLRLTGRTPVVSRRIDRFTTAQRSSSKNVAGRRMIRSVGVVLQIQQANPEHRGLWQRVGHFVQDLARRVTHFDAPGVTF